MYYRSFIDSSLGLCSMSCYLFLAYSCSMVLLFICFLCLCIGSINSCFASNKYLFYVLLFIFCNPTGQPFQDSAVFFNCVCIERMISLLVSLIPFWVVVWLIYTWRIGRFLCILSINSTWHNDVFSGWFCKSHLLMPFPSDQCNPSSRTSSEKGPLEDVGMSAFGKPLPLWSSRNPGPYEKNRQRLSSEKPHVW